MKRLFLLLPLLLATAPTARATIYADLFAGTVTGRNDGLAEVVITDGSEIVKTVSESAKSPPGTQTLKPHEKLTVPMNRDGFKYYLNEFARLKRQGIKALSNKNKNVQNNDCPPGKRIYQKTALFGLIKGTKLCLSDYEAESLRQAQAQNAIKNINEAASLRQEEESLRQQRMQNLWTNMNQNRIINCTSNTFGSYMSTTCY